MGIRETLNDNPTLVVRSTLAMIGLAVIFVVWYVLPTRQRANIPREYFTDDDGQTWFSYDSSELAPFEHNGKEAVLAKVFRCHNGTKFVGYLEKFTEDGRRRVIDARLTGHMKAGAAAVEQGVPTADLVVKKPHDIKWIAVNDPKAIEIQTIQCPDGSTDYEPLLP